MVKNYAGLWRDLPRYSRSGTLENTGPDETDILGEPAVRSFHFVVGVYGFWVQGLGLGFMAAALG